MQQPEEQHAQKQGSGGGAHEQRLDQHHQHQHVGPAGASANNDDAASTAPGSSASREAVTLTEGHVHQQQSSPIVASTCSHGTGGGERQRQKDDHVSSASSASRPSAAMGMDTGIGAAAESYEQQHVHSVYESIASHFSATRYKPWPVVASFLESLPPGSVGLDVGCGNGKYLDVNRDIVILGSDRSANLVRLARDLKVVGSAAESRGKSSAGAEVVGVADGLELPFGGSRRVDFAICIAVLHHLSTRERRIEGVKALLDCVVPGAGKVLVYVWALEQGSSRRGWDEGTADQDQLVPWVLRQNKKKLKKEASREEDNGRSPDDKDTGDTTYQRYYHLYRKGELEEDAVAAGGEILDSGYDKDNWWAIASPKE
ncbi:S-adenosyl-L-methionine-dependent methyltransferase [Hypoxylon fuscum]|nr:S-adenosyl-L-methionine-dependent methyltransferase [Hypoxylon fuscum]